MNVMNTEGYCLAAEENEAEDINNGMYRGLNVPSGSLSTL